MAKYRNLTPEQLRQLQKNYRFSGMDPAQISVDSSPLVGNDFSRAFEDAFKQTPTRNTFDFTPPASSQGLVADRPRTTVQPQPKVQMPRVGTIAPPGTGSNRLAGQKAQARAMEQAKVFDNYLATLPEDRIDAAIREAQNNPELAPLLQYSMRARARAMGQATGVLPPTQAEKDQQELTARQEYHRWQKGFDADFARAQRTGDMELEEKTFRRKVAQFNPETVLEDKGAINRVKRLKLAVDNGDLYGKDAWKKIDEIVDAYAKDTETPNQRAARQTAAAEKKSQEQAAKDAERGSQVDEDRWYKQKERDYKMVRDEMSDLDKAIKEAMADSKDQGINSSDESRAEAKERVKELRAEWKKLAEESQALRETIRGGYKPPTATAQGQPAPATQPTATTQPAATAGQPAPSPDVETQVADIEASMKGGATWEQVKANLTPEFIQSLTPEQAQRIKALRDAQAKAGN